MIRVLFFGPVADHIDTREMNIEFSSGMTLQDVVAMITAQYPTVFDIVSFIAVNQKQVHDHKTQLSDNDVVALLAKFSGG